MSELGLLEELGLKHSSYSADFLGKDEEFFDVTRAADELQRHDNRKETSRSASVEYLDARTRSATRAGSGNKCQL
eukprot:1909119-Pyramimonas_sp.AAC.1